MKSHLFFLVLFFFLLIFAFCSEPVAEHKGKSEAGIKMKPGDNLPEISRPTNWEYGGTLPGKNTLGTNYANNIPINIKFEKSVPNPPKVYMLMAVKDTVNGLFLLAQDEFLNNLSGSTIKLIFDDVEERVYSFGFAEVDYLGNVFPALSIMEPSAIFDRLYHTENLALFAELKDLGIVEMVFVTKGFFLPR